MGRRGVVLLEMMRDRRAEGPPDPSRARARVVAAWWQRSSKVRPRWVEPGQEALRRRVRVTMRQGRQRTPRASVIATRRCGRKRRGGDLFVRAGPLRIGTFVRVRPRGSGATGAPRTALFRSLCRPFPLLFLVVVVLDFALSSNSRGGGGGGGHHFTLAFPALGVTGTDASPRGGDGLPRRRDRDALVLAALLGRRRVAAGRLEARGAERPRRVTFHLQRGRRETRSVTGGMGNWVSARGRSAERKVCVRACGGTQGRKGGPR